MPSEFTRHAAAERGIEIVNGNVKCLGGMVGVDDAAAVALLNDKLAKQSPITDAIKDSRFPLIRAPILCENQSHPQAHLPPQGDAPEGYIGPHL